MSILDKNEKEVLLKSARASILNALGPAPGKDDGIVSDPKIRNLKTPRGCFVTLTIRGRLRGCIGTIEPIMPLIDGIVQNARKAAFDDPRFAPVTEDEMKQVDIEVSVLTPPRRLDFTDPEDLKKQLVPGKHGVIIHREGRSAVFLPQVWKQLPKTEQFLENLCLKCSLPADAW
jgi:AmmeMemoRadiSam system protein A